MYTLLIYISESMFTHEVMLNDTRVSGDPLDFASAIMSFKNHFTCRKTGRLVVTIINTTDNGSIIHSHEDLRHPIKEKIVINRPAMKGATIKPKNSNAGWHTLPLETTSDLTWTTLLGQAVQS